MYHVVGHSTELEDHRQSHQAELARWTENGVCHRLRAAEDHHVLRYDLVEAHLVQHRHLADFRSGVTLQQLAVP